MSPWDRFTQWRYRRRLYRVEALLRQASKELVGWRVVGWEHGPAWVKPHDEIRKQLIEARQMVGAIQGWMR